MPDNKQVVMYRGKPISEISDKELIKSVEDLMGYFKSTLSGAKSRIELSQMLGVKDDTEDELKSLSHMAKQIVKELSVRLERNPDGSNRKNNTDNEQK